MVCAKFQKLNNEVNVDQKDLIDNLPCEIVQDCLSLFLTKDTVRTSVCVEVAIPTGYL